MLRGLTLGVPCIPLSGLAKPRAHVALPLQPIGFQNCIKGRPHTSLGVCRLGGRGPSEEHFEQPSNPNVVWGARAPQIGRAILGTAVPQKASPSVTGVAGRALGGPGQMSSDSGGAPWRLASELTSTTEKNSPEIRLARARTYPGCYTRQAASGHALGIVDPRAWRPLKPF